MPAPMPYRDLSREERDKLLGYKQNVYSLANNVMFLHFLDSLGVEEYVPQGQVSSSYENSLSTTDSEVLCLNISYISIPVCFYVICRWVCLE